MRPVLFCALMFLSAVYLASCDDHIAKAPEFPAEKFGYGRIIGTYTIDRGTLKEITKADLDKITRAIANEKQIDDEEASMIAAEQTCSMQMGMAFLSQKSLEPTKFVFLHDHGANLCRITSGRWEDFYTGEIIDDAAKVTLDHIVPLKDAWESGTFKWSRAKLLDWENDQSNLVITSIVTQTSKGNQGIGDWQPDSNGVACEYFNRYSAIKIENGLTFSSDEFDALEDMHETNVRRSDGTKFECHMNAVFSEFLWFDTVKRTVLIRD